MTIIDEIFFDSSLTIIFKSKITSPGESLGNLGSRMELSMIQNQISMNLDDDYNSDFKVEIGLLLKDDVKGQLKSTNF